MAKIPCNNCNVRGCSGRLAESLQYCKHQIVPREFRRPLMEVAVWGEIIKFGYVKNVSRIRELRPG